MKKLSLSTLWLLVATYSSYGSADTESKTQVSPSSEKNESVNTQAMPVAQKTSEINTLQQALERAYENNTNLSQQQAKLRATNNDVAKAKGGWRPSISATATSSYSEASGNGVSNSSTPATGSENNRNVTYGVQLQQNIYQGGQTQAQIERTESESTAAKFGLIQTGQDIFYKTIQSYLDIIQKEEEIVLLKKNVEVLLKTLQAAQHKFTAGEETRTSVAQAEAELKNGEAELQKAVAQLEGSRATFTQLTNSKVGKLKDPSDFSALPKTLDLMVEKANENNPSLQSASFSAKAASSSINEAKAGWRPTVDMSVSANRSNNILHYKYDSADVRNYTTRQNKTTYQAQVQVKVPLYAPTANAEIRKAHETSEAARINIEETRRKIVSDLSTAYASFQSSKANISFYEAKVKASEVSLAGTMQEIEVGSKILLEGLREQAKLIDAQLKVVQSRAQWRQAGFQLLSLMGLLTPENLKLNVTTYDPDVYYNTVRNKW